jgi:hypothetical protein
MTGAVQNKMGHKACQPGKGSLLPVLTLKYGECVLKKNLHGLLMDPNPVLIHFVLIKGPVVKQDVGAVNPDVIIILQRLDDPPELIRQKILHLLAIGIMGVCCGHDPPPFSRVPDPLRCLIPSTN